VITIAIVSRARSTAPGFVVARGVGAGAIAVLSEPGDLKEVPRVPDGEIVGEATGPTSGIELRDGAGEGTGEPHEAAVTITRSQTASRIWSAVG